MPVTFQNLDHPKIQKCFNEVWERYESLHDHEIVVMQRRINGSTMQAQPDYRLSDLFSGVRRYKIKVAMYVRDSDKIKVEDLPEEVITGWFAHELGHVQDYLHRNKLQMGIFGLRYLISPKFKRETEYIADYNAIEKGFKSEILASKRFILESGLVHQEYIDKISAFYLSIEAVELCPDGEVVLPTTSL